MAAHRGERDELVDRSVAVDDEVRALDTVRSHIKNTIAEANLGQELASSSLDSRLAALKNQTGDVTARQELDALKSGSAAPAPVARGSPASETRASPRTICTAAGESLM